jgi:hypothetical protein
MRGSETCCTLTGRRRSEPRLRLGRLISEYSLGEATRSAARVVVVAPDNPVRLSAPAMRLDANSKRCSAQLHLLHFQVPLPSLSRQRKQKHTTHLRTLSASSIVHERPSFRTATTHTPARPGSGPLPSSLLPLALCPSTRRPCAPCARQMAFTLFASPRPFKPRAGAASDAGSSKSASHASGAPRPAAGAPGGGSGAGGGGGGGAGPSRTPRTPLPLPLPRSRGPPPPQLWSTRTMILFASCVGSLVSVAPCAVQPRREGRESHCGGGGGMRWPAGRQMGAAGRSKRAALGRRASSGCEWLVWPDQRRWTRKV